MKDDNTKRYTIFGKIFSSHDFDIYNVLPKNGFTSKDIRLHHIAHFEFRDHFNPDKPRKKQLQSFKNWDFFWNQVMGHILDEEFVAVQQFKKRHSGQIRRGLALGLKGSLIIEDKNNKLYIIRYPFH